MGRVGWPSPFFLLHAFKTKDEAQVCKTRELLALQCKQANIFTGTSESSKV
jgi:hypothetical protein